MVIETRTNVIEADKLKKVKKEVVALVGLGYVGLPLADAFSRNYKVIGYDMKAKLVNKMNSEKIYDFLATTDPKSLAEADFIIIAVPTPINEFKEPDLSPVINASRIVSQYMKTGCTVILESTVYPGVTEEIVKPILEETGKKCGRDFKIAYCPERINPGDEEHGIGKTVKVVSGMDEETTEAVAQLYATVAARVFRARNIKTAEAAKVIENVQRDLNIALVNELSLIFERLGLKTSDVMDAAGTKWNFHRYSPGMVGGHCIPVDPYYLVRKAKELGYEARVILAGRSVNDYMPVHISQMIIKGLNDMNKVIKGSKVLLMGLTYKENVPDTRETPTKEMIKELKKYRVELLGFDPVLNGQVAEFDVKGVTDLSGLKDIDCIVLCVGHQAFRQFSLADLKAVMSPNPVLIDVRGFYNGEDAEKMGFYYKTL
jgi:UDPglucose 6-dehydrogenase/UDP-N-acetyl-D-galactosamine dehydrogenase